MCEAAREREVWYMAKCKTCRQGFITEYRKGHNPRVTLDQEAERAHKKKCPKCKTMNFYD